tara:strand:- start:1336 stop:2799 length:1464 start_codon:yes stop_codon:yes gene_type:complete
LKPSKPNSKNRDYYPDVTLIIDGEFIKRKGKPVVNPSTGEAFSEVPHASEKDIDLALRAAKHGFEIWSKFDPIHRENLMRRASHIIRERCEQVAYAITREQGKPIRQATAEILRTCEIIEWDASEGRRTYGRIIPAKTPLRHSVIRQPIGPVAAFSPWNFPISSPGRKVAGALAAGCSIILKASEETPAGAFELVKAFHDAGVPEGTVNLIFGEPAQISTRLIESKVIRLVTFTGSILVGKQLAGLAAKQMKPAIMELGGHAPVLVDQSINSRKIAEVCLLGKSRNAGQVCVSPTRFFVHENIFSDFVDSFIEAANNLKIGNGTDKGTEMGPVANERRLSAIEHFINDSIENGAKLAAGGNRIGNQGYFHQMTVLTDVPNTARVMREEPFGPLAIVNKVQSMDDAIKIANELPYGLAAYAFSNSASIVEQITQNVEAGNVSINHLTASVAETPFGGIKESGYGREGGTEGLQCYTVVKNISHLTSDI